MTRRTLLDFFADVTSGDAAKSAQFLVYDDGYRTWTWTYGDLAAAARTHEIFVVEGGRTAEHGTHAELLALGGRYARMWGR